MGLIREPLDVDFIVEPHELTEEEKSAISTYIRDYKMKTAEKSKATTTGKIVAPKRSAVKQ
jgi:hypothetical protein